VVGFLRYLNFLRQTKGGNWHLNFAAAALCMESEQMSWKGYIAAGLLVTSLGISASAADLKITLPKRSHLTPVQRLNQEGVEAINKHHYEKAESLFYKAYLLDPDDPFTLNNLGYISELKGQVDRALNFYQLAGQESTEAVIARSSSPELKGRPVKEALAIPDLPLEINHDNVEAVRMLSQGRAPEADLFLTRVLKKDPNNIFTLNNLGVAKEMEGESQEALRLYEEAAALGSNASAVVTLNPNWRGKPVRQMAAQNASNLQARMENQRTVETRLAELNVRGVSALNRNDLSAAEQDFRAAYTLDPNNAFAVNNIGYLSEIDGDRETAQFYYDKAQSLPGANAKVGLASRGSAEGSRLSQVASENDSKVGAKVSQAQQAVRAQHEPVVLYRRDNTPVQEPNAANSHP
jgi:Flp pilus assembly protein TadD